MVADASPGVDFFLALQTLCFPVTFAIHNKPKPKASAGFSGFPFIHGLFACNCCNNLFMLLVRVSSLLLAPLFW